MKTWTTYHPQAGRITLTRWPGRGATDRGQIHFIDYDGSLPSPGRWTGIGDGAILTITSDPQKGYCYNECGELVSR